MSSLSSPDSGDRLRFKPGIRKNVSSRATHVSHAEKRHYDHQHRILRHQSRRYPAYRHCLPLLHFDSKSKVQRPVKNAIRFRGSHHDGVRFGEKCRNDFPGFK